MSASLILGCLWVVAATGVSFFPMRRQFAPGMFLLIAAPVLLAFIGYQHGIWITMIGLFAFVSMFRNPLRYLWAKARGLNPELPKELQAKD
ncbi:MAG: DUF2484 family protein [Pseudomonadota bacterium]